MFARALVAAALVALVSADCNTPSGTQCTISDQNTPIIVCDGKKIDLSGIHPSGSDYFQAMGALGQYTYFLQVIKGGMQNSPPTCGGGSTINYGAIGGQLDSTQTCYSLPTASSLTAYYESGNGKIHLAYTDSDPTNPKCVYVDISCDKGAKEPTYKALGESQTHQYPFVITAAAVCGGGGGGGGGGGSKGGKTEVGWILTGLFLGLSFVYFVGGAIFLKTQREKTGREMVPHVEFWSSLPGLIKDGFLFTFAKIRRQEYQPL